MRFCAEVIRPCHSRSQSPTLLRVTKGEKSSEKPWDGPGSDWFSVITLKTLLIGQSVTRVKYERTTGSWREKERALEMTAVETIVRRNTFNPELHGHEPRKPPLPPPKENPVTRTKEFAVVAILLCLISYLFFILFYPIFFAHAK